MNDNQLGIEIRKVLVSGLTEIGLTGVEVTAGYQPTTQGEDADPTIYFFKVGDSNTGWQYRKTVELPDDKVGVKESRNVATTWQFYALSIPDPSNLSKPTASDLLNAAAMILQSASAIKTLQGKGIGVQVVGELRNPYFTNASDQFEASPSFDFTVSHRRSIIKNATAIEEINGDTNPV